MRYKLISFVLVLCLFFPSLAVAQEENTGEPSGHWTPLQLAIWNPVQIFPEDWDVYGLRTSIIYGKNRDVYGLDIRLLIGSSHNMRGIQVGGFLNEADELMGIQYGFGNRAGGNTVGIQVGIGNHYWTGFQRPPGSQHMTGIQCGIFENTADYLSGVQIAVMVNGSIGTVNGVQIALTNMNIWGGGNIEGIQLGVLNISEKVKGVQIGIVNFCHRMTGIQIGGINIITEGRLPFFPLVNASFSF